MALSPTSIHRMSLSRTKNLHQTVRITWGPTKVAPSLEVRTQSFRTLSWCSTNRSNVRTALALISQWIADLNQSVDSPRLSWSITEPCISCSTLFLISMSSILLARFYHPLFAVLIMASLERLSIAAFASFVASNLLPATLILVTLALKILFARAHVRSSPIASG